MVLTARTWGLAGEASRTEELNVVTREWSRAKVFSYMVPLSPSCPFRHAHLALLACMCISRQATGFQRIKLWLWAAVAGWPAQAVRRVRQRSGCCHLWLPQPAAGQICGHPNCRGTQLWYGEKKQPPHPIWVLLINVKYSCYTDSHSQTEKGPCLHIFCLARETKLTFGKTCNWRELKISPSLILSNYMFCWDRLQAPLWLWLLTHGWMLAKHSFWLVKL